jgi:hypothetical protein
MQLPHVPPGPVALPDADLDTLATALYVRIDDWLKTEPQCAPWRPAAGIIPELNDAEALTLAALQALLGYVSEARWLRLARRQMRHPFPCLPGQPGYNKRLRKLAGTMCRLIRVLAAAAPCLHAARAPGRIRAGRREGRRAPGAAGHPGRPGPAGL